MNLNKNQLSLIIIVAVVIVAGVGGFKMLTQNNTQAAALYESAITDKQAFEFEASQNKLKAAQQLVDAESEMAFKIQDELNIHLSLVKIQKLFFDMYIDDAIQLVADVEAYMQKESSRLRGDESTDEIIALIERLKLAIDARDKTRLSKIKSFMIQYGQVRSYRYASTKEFADWVKLHMPPNLEMKLIKHKGDYINKIYKHEAEFIDTRHNLRIVLDTDGKEVLVEPVNAEPETEQSAEAKQAKETN